MEALQNIKMVEAARTEARAMVDKDENFTLWPKVKKHLAERLKDARHFE